MTKLVNYYYDFTGDLTQDPEGNLVQLCRTCVRNFRADEHDLEFAQEGDEDSECEYCEASNNPTNPLQHYERNFDMNKPFYQETPGRARGG